MSEQSLGEPTESSLKPDLQFADAEWHAVPFEQINNLSLAPFQIISDIPSLSSCRRVEEQISRTLLKGASPERFSSKLALDQQPEVMDDPIINHLRPKGFNGSIVNAKVLLLPFNAERAVQLRPGLRGKLESGELTDDTPGVSVIYSGDMRISRTGIVGSIFQEASYFLKRPVKGIPSDRRDDLGRCLGSEMQVTEAARVIDQQAGESQQVAEQVARFALRHVYSGGAPGLGRRR